MTTETIMAASPRATHAIGLSFPAYGVKVTPTLLIAWDKLGGWVATGGSAAAAALSHAWTMGDAVLSQTAPADAATCLAALTNKHTPIAITPEVTSPIVAAAVAPDPHEGQTPEQWLTGVLTPTARERVSVWAAQGPHRELWAAFATAIGMAVATPEEQASTHQDNQPPPEGAGNAEV